MVYEIRPRFAILAVPILLLSIAIDCYAQQERQDHSCTVDAAGSFAFPKGEDGKNFQNGWGLQAGGGFSISRPPERRGARYYVTANYMYEQFKATSAALALAKAANSAELANATSAHGSFSSVTIDPTVRIVLSQRISFNGSGGFGWFRRGISFQGANPDTLLQSSGISLDRLASNSGAFDFGGGVNFGLRKDGGLMLFAEIRSYRGTAINRETTLLPISFGVRW
jgi:hypothetical protein